LALGTRSGGRDQAAAQERVKYRSIGSGSADLDNHFPWSFRDFAYLCQVLGYDLSFFSLGTAQLSTDASGPLETLAPKAHRVGVHLAMHMARGDALSNVAARTVRVRRVLSDEYLSIKTDK